MVHDCLQDVPINKTAAVAQLSWLSNFLQFQTTLSYLKNPTPEYQPPAVDLMGGLSEIAHKAAAGGYASEYDFELETATLIASAADGHLTYLPTLVQTFTYSRNVSLVSISEDGLTLPKIYVRSDVTSNLTDTSSSLKISPVSSVNGQPVDKFLASIGYLTLGQDLDAQYNTLLYNPSTDVDVIANGRGDTFNHHSFVVHDDYTSLTFENGTMQVFTAIAEAGKSQFDFSSGKDLYEKHLLPQPPAPAAASPLPAVSQPHGYPKPSIQHSAGLVSGYFLSSSSPNADTAILSIASFDAGLLHALAEFQKVVSDFLALCKTNSKTKLIIDVRGNGGGNPVLAYDLFKQLFPKEVPYSGLRARSNVGLNAVGRVLSAAPGDTAGGTIVDARHMLQSPDGAPYVHWDKLAGPVPNHGDSFTELTSWELGNSSATPNFGQGLPVSGYENRTDLPPQLLSSEDITLVCPPPFFPSPLSYFTFPYISKAPTNLLPAL